ncbi:MAG: 3-isopropylmalate/(R)-2-methylmalate dehydratase large subunit [Candidatus Eremiobacteraeota bacterium]|jgi:3-isopropylmalate/(R)-2-methylmalate dehydratase large subunit|nr:3-isopropylmalate/(R)-2-methylmalate dehydratase large subunit [Candidatus Eremiobacteraeota bacterium]
MPRSLFDKIWDAHVVEELPGGNALVFVDLIVAHEITTPPGALTIESDFGDALYDPRRIVALLDHVAPAKDSATALQAQTVRTWAKRQGVTFHDIGDNGICHVIVPERGNVTPGMTVCCGDSHTCTLGAFGAFALGIGTTAQTGAMLAGCLILQRPKVMRVEITGELAPDATAKDLALTVIANLTFRGGTGFVLEYTGSGVRALTMEQRMTLCNMAIETGATTGIIAADATTAAYLAATPLAPQHWVPERADDDARYDATVTIDASAVRPRISWGTNPGESAPANGIVPLDAPAASLEYMGLVPGQRIDGIAIDQAFIGSCTNARISDLRAAAEVFRGRRVSVPTIVTPGSQAVRRQAEREGLHDIFQDAGALWTHSSCGPCLGMSMGVLAPGMRCVSSSNRNFPGRMGDGGRVHLAAPVVVAASAILGRLATPADLAAEAVPA